MIDWLQLRGGAIPFLFVLRPRSEVAACSIIRGPCPGSRAPASAMIRSAEWEKLQVLANSQESRCSLHTIRSWGSLLFGQAELPFKNTKAPMS